MYNKARKKISIIFMFQMLDFVCTWIGINIYNVIEEGNPFMVWLFNLPPLKAYIARWFFLSIVSLLFLYIYKNNQRYFNVLFVFSLIANVIIMVLHVIWILIFLYMGCFYTLTDFLKNLILYMIPSVPTYFITLSFIDLLNTRYNVIK